MASGASNDQDGAEAAPDPAWGWTADPPVPVSAPDSQRETDEHASCQRQKHVTGTSWYRHRQ